MIACKISSVYMIVLPPFITAILETISSFITLGMDNLLTPLECIGLSGFVMKLTFWMAVTPVVFPLLCLLLAAWMRLFGEKQYAVWVVSMGMRMLFLFFILLRV